MAHEVTVQVPPRPIAHKDIVFLVKRDGSRFGRLKVSKGAIVWLPGNKSKGYLLTWQQLANLAAEHGKRGNFPV